MLGWRILRHSFSMVMNNFNDAVRISIPIVVAMGLSLILFGPDTFVGSSDPMTTMGPEFAMQTVVSALLQVIGGLWVAVAWHRFILLEERPTSWIPAFHGSRILAYFGYSLVILLVVIVMSLIGGFGIGLAFSGGVMSLAGAILIIVAVVLGVYAMVRLSVVFPSAAIGQSMGLSAAWRATDGYAMAIFVGYIIFMVIAVLIGAVFGAIAAFTGIVGAILILLVDVFLTVVGVSFLTTIYGITVEKRELS